MESSDTRSPDDSLITFSDDQSDAESESEKGNFSPYESNSESDKENIIFSDSELGNCSIPPPTISENIFFCHLRTLMIRVRVLLRVKKELGFSDCDLAPQTPISCGEHFSTDDEFLNQEFPTLAAAPLPSDVCVYS